MEEGTHLGSRHVRKSDQMAHDQPVSQQSNSPSQAFQCNYCILIFKSKYFLHEHVSKVHGFDVDTPQCEGDLTPPKTATAPTLKSLYEYSGDLFACRHCVFTSSSWPIIFKHERIFHKDGRGTVKPRKTQSKAKWKKATKTESATRQEEMEKINSSTSKSTSKTSSSSSLLKDLETRTGSSGNISVSPSQSTLKSSVLKSPDQETDVQVVTKSEPMNTHNCLLCSFTSSSLMDLRSHQQQKHVYLYNMRANLGPAKTTLPGPETALALGSSPKTAKRSHDDLITSLYPAMKKRKEDASSLESIVIKTKLSGGSSFTFEVSGDEEEECAFEDEMVDHADVADGESSDHSSYCCKLCNFSHKSSRGVSSHYQKMHPYIRYTFQYILDPDDKSATFRCLECPIEFATVDDLKKHYKDYHPQAPDVFTLRSDQLALVYKCFICTYTTTNGRLLKIHVRDFHPTKKINNPLMYCSYTVKNPQEKHSQSQTLSGTSSPRTAGIMSPKKVQAPRSETSNTPPKAGPILKRVDEDIYHCKHCTFSNKSVAVTLDHYQKTHPESGVTIDQIKLASLLTSSTRKTDKLHMPQEMVPESSEFQGIKSPNSSCDKSDDPPEDLEKLFFCQVCHCSLPTVKGIITHQRRAHSGLKVTALQIHTYTAKVRNDEKKSQLLATVSTKETPSSQLLATASAKETPSSSSDVYGVMDNLFFCQVCNYGHPSLRGILNHQSKKHVDLKGNSDLVLKHTTRLREQTQTSVGEDSPFTLPFPLMQKDSKKMLFCQWCNFSQSTMRGIMNHQGKRHRKMERSVQEITKYTARVHKHAGKSQLITDSPNSSFCSPGVSDRKQIYFCQRCDYSNSTVRGIMNHQRVKHHDLKISGKEIVRHTAAVRSRTDKKKKKPSGNNPSTTASPIKSKESGELRSLQCRKCPYTTPRLYLLRRHLIKNHQKVVTIAELVRSAYRDGQLEPGYHCQWCAYSHAEADRVYQHGQEQHPQYTSISLEHITLRLYAGPKRPRAKKQGPRSESNVKQEHAPLFRKDTKTSPSQKSGGKAAFVYPCRACPFKSTSIVGIKCHYRAVHPWSVKDDGSVLDVISSRQPSENRQNPMDVHNKIPASLDRQEQPVDGSGKLTESISSHETSTSSRTFKCPVCSTLFNTWHGFKTHCGRKHPEYKPDPTEHKYEDLMNDDTSVYSVYKCKLCRYVNTRGHGVLTHCQMKHPSFKAKRENLETKMVTFSNTKHCMRTKSGRVSGLRGFLCKLCPVAHASLFRLKAHYKSDHSRAASTKLKIVKQATVIKKQLLSKYRNTQAQGSISKAGVLRKRKRKRKCHRCTFVCSTMKSLASHIHTSHKSTAEHTYTCSLCTYSTVVPLYLENHYRRKHGQGAHDQYYVPLQKRLNLKQNTEACPSISPDLQASGENEPGADTAVKNIKTKPYKGKRASSLFEAASGKGPFKCMKCTVLSFDSPLLLSIHYTQFHRSDFKQDFTVLSRTMEKGSELYCCGYCDIEIQGDQELCSHLKHHAVFLKRAKPVLEAQPRAKSDEPENEELPKTSLSKTTEMVGREKRLDKATDFPCDQCGRAFMSLTGLRSHERSHAALAALKRQGPLPKHILEEHYSYRPGNLKEFRCRLCGYRTNLMIFLKSHLLRNHKAEYPDKDLSIPTTSSKDMDNNLRANEVPKPSVPQEGGVMTEPPNEHVLKQKRGYLEPPDVQRQLNRYRQMSLTKAPAPAPLQSTMPFKDGLFHCEFCNFTSEHISSVRRHYISRHNGKKLLRCKDCSFFTCFRKKFEMHMAAGGASCLAEAPKDLRCPLCIYHTRNRNNMIDHIDLHREERVAPIELRRPPLSRYLEGIVFRCHKCTFTSACDENLRLHMLKHDDIKPYKCRLCYFDCIQLSELEAHLCDKHQVMRNHELVGQVNLVQLETRHGKANGEKEGTCNMEPRNKEKEDKEIKFEHEKQGQEREENIAEQDYKQNRSQQNIGEQTEDGMANHNKMEQNNEVKAEQHNDVENTLENHSEMHERQGQERQNMTGPDDRYHEKHEGRDVVKRNCESHPMQGQGLEEEFNPEAKNHYNNEKQIREETRDGVSPDRLICQRHGFTDENDGGQNEKCNERHGKDDKESLEEPSMNCEEDPVRKERNNDGHDQYGEMPVLENVYHREGTSSSLEEEEEEEDDKPEKADKCNKMQEQGCEEKKDLQDERAEHAEYVREERRENDATSEPQDGSTSVRKNPLISNEKPFACKLCGRTLTNTIELQRHVMRHGL